MVANTGYPRLLVGGCRDGSVVDGRATLHWVDGRVLEVVLVTNGYILPVVDVLNNEGGEDEDGDEDEGEELDWEAVLGGVEVSDWDDDEEDDEEL